MAFSFRAGNFAFRMDREVSHATFRVLRESLAHSQYTLWTLWRGVIHSTGGLREIYHREIDLARTPPPPRLCCLCALRGVACVPRGIKAVLGGDQAAQRPS